MNYKTTIIADTTAKNDVAAEVELTVIDGILQDIVIECPDNLDIDDKIFFSWEAINEIEKEEYISIDGNPKYFFN